MDKPTHGFKRLKGLNKEVVNKVVLLLVEEIRGWQKQKSTMYDL